MAATVESLDLLLRMTEKNGGDIALVYPEENEDFIRGYIAGQVDALWLALEHARDIVGAAVAHAGYPGPAPDRPGSLQVCNPCGEANSANCLGGYSRPSRANRNPQAA
jgi:hypothetical protein